jgi:hypothetical protein
MKNRMHWHSYALPTLLCCVGFTLLPGHLGAEIIFDNTQRSFNNMFYASTNEFGDEVALGGTGRTITAFQCEYYAGITNIGQQTASVRFYANDGLGQSDLGEFAQPGTKLYESEPLKIYNGYNLISLPGLSIPVTNDNITWTVQFKGISGKYPDWAGLLFYDAPTVGASYDDFWMKKGTNWGAYRYTTMNIKANFCARLTATPDTPAEVTVHPLANGARHLTIQGPSYRSGVLECTQDGTNWKAMKQFIFQGKPMEYTDAQIYKGAEPQYRARLLTNYLLQVNAQRPATNGFATIQIIGTPGQCATLEVSSNLMTWTPVYTNHLTSIFIEYQHDLRSVATPIYYRATDTWDEPILMATTKRLPDGQLFQSIAGPPGVDYVLQTSTNLVTWTDVQTNTFSFLHGVANHPLPTRPEAQRQFYRVQLLPISY